MNYKLLLMLKKYTKHGENMNKYHVSYHDIFCILSSCPVRGCAFRAYTKISYILFCEELYRTSLGVSSECYFLHSYMIHDM